MPKSHYTQQHYNHNDFLRSPYTFAHHGGDHKTRREFLENRKTNDAEEETELTDREERKTEMTEKRIYNASQTFTVPGKEKDLK